MVKIQEQTFSYPVVVNYHDPFGDQFDRVYTVKQAFLWLSYSTFRNMFHKHGLFYLSPCFSNVNFSYLREWMQISHRSFVGLYIIFISKGSRENMSSNPNLNGKVKSPQLGWCSSTRTPLRPVCRKLKISSCTRASPVVAHPPPMSLLSYCRLHCHLCPPSWHPPSSQLHFISILSTPSALLVTAFPFSDSVCFPIHYVSFQARRPLLPGKSTLSLQVPIYFCWCSSIKCM